MDLALQPMLKNALEMAECCGPDEWVEVSGDLRALIMWHEHEDGSRSVTDLYFWA